MWSLTRKILILGFGGCLLLSACGYRLSSSLPIALPDGVQELYLEKVENPTTTPWLNAFLRTVVQEEFSRRSEVRWSKRSEAQGIVRVKVHKFTESTKLEDPDELTVKSEVSAWLQIRILSAKGRDLLWDSGTVYGRESFVGEGQGRPLREAQERALDNALERALDKLSHNF